MVEFGRCRGGGRRAALREKNPSGAVYSTVGKSHPAVVIDVSLTGARLRSDETPATGEELMLSFEGLRVFGVVAWAEDGQFGLAFEPALTALELRRLQQRAAKYAGLPPEVTAALDDWTLGIAR
jgi:hypothetical protein